MTTGHSTSAPVPFARRALTRLAGLAGLAGPCLIAGPCVIALTLMLSIAGCGKGGPHAQRPAVILVTVDTLRADHLGVYGYVRDTSPELDRFASGGRIFTHAYANAPETCPSFSSIMTGFLPHETQVTTNLVYLPETIETLAETLQAEGYATAAFVSNFVLRADSQFDQGFDVYDDTMTELESNREMPERNATATADAAIAWLESADATRPFFLWVHFQDPHGPYTPPAAHETRFDDDGLGVSKTLRVNATITGNGGIPSYQALDDHTDAAHYIARYDAEIRYFDEQFGRLVAAIDDRIGVDRALTVFASDHGEGMGEHEYWFAHGENVYAGVLRVPLILRGTTVSGPVKAGDVRTAVQMLDIVPTIRAAIGMPTDPALRGQDLLATNLDEQPIFSETRRYRSLVRGRFGLAHDRKLGASYLFDLVADPNQTRELGRLQPGVVTDLREELDRLENEDRLDVEAVVPEINAQAIDHLIKLGYLESRDKNKDEDKE